MDNTQNLLTSELHIDPIGHAHLKETAKWAKFLGIVGFVVSAILVIIALFSSALLSSLPNFNGATPVSAGLISVLYLFIAVIYFFMSLYLFRFAVKMQRALTSNDQESLNGSFLNLKIVYRILGIIMVIYLGLIALGIVGLIGVALMS